jgi:hypothetical protein
MTIGLKNSQEYALHITVAIIFRMLRALTETQTVLIWDTASMFQFPIGMNLLRIRNVKHARKHKFSREMGHLQNYHNMDRQMT